MDPVSLIFDNKLIAFLLVGLIAPGLLKLIDHWLNRGTEKRLEWSILIENYRREVERLTQENDRLQRLLHTKEEEVEELWKRQRIARNEWQTTLFAREEELQRLLRKKEEEDS